MTEILLWAYLGLGNTPAFMPAYDAPKPTTEVLLSLERLPRKDPRKVAPVLVDGDRMALLSLHRGTGKELISQNADRPQPIASITKLMTAYVVRRDLNLNDEVVVSERAAVTGGAGIDLLRGESLTVETLLSAIIIPSANDAAIALAEAHSGDVETFVTVMNDTAKTLGLTTAQFSNPTGLDPDNAPPNQMSARDVARLFQLVLADPKLRQMMGEAEFFGTSVDEQFSHEKPTTNQLLGNFQGVSRGKTGYTEDAGQCLVVLGRTDGQEVISVILGSEDRFGETKNVLDWIYNAYRF